MAEKNYEKQYYSSILSSIDKNDSQNFYNEMNNAIKSGNLEVFINRSRQQLSFDSTWVHQIKDYLKYVENIVRNPRIYMQAIEEVTPIQRAKKINARSIQHLSSHVQNVQELRKDGTIVPSKVLSTTFEDTFAIYENRFVMTLINKLAAFVEVRYNSILESIKSYQADKIVTKSNFVWRNYTVEAKIELNVREEIIDEVSKKNQDLLDDIIVIRNFARGFMNSSFYQTMRERTRPVTPPILRTNIITKSVDYNSCLKLWLFLDSYRQLGVDLQVMDKELSFDDNYINEVSDMIFMNYSLFASNQDDRKDNYELLPYKMRKEKKAKSNKLLVATDEENLNINEQDYNEPTISEYFYQRVKKNYKSEFTEQVKSGISYNKSFVNVYRKMLKIENGIQEEIIESMQKQKVNTTSINEKRRAKFKQLKKIKRMYQGLIFAKEQDLEKAKAKLEKTNKVLELYEKEEKAYQAELRAQRRKQLRDYRLSKQIEEGKITPQEALEIKNKEDNKTKRKPRKVIASLEENKEKLKEEHLQNEDLQPDTSIAQEEVIEVKETKTEHVQESNNDSVSEKEDNSSSIGVSSRTAKLMEYLQRARQASRSKEVKVFNHNEDK